MTYSFTAAAALRTAASQLGVTDGGTNRVRYWAELKPEWMGSPWCAAFIQWVLKQHGGWYDAPLPYYVPSIEAHARAAGTWRGPGATPLPGDLVVYGYSQGTHVGFVEKALSDGTIQTLEGNTSSGTLGSQTNGDGVYRRRRSRSWVRGFVRMPYAATTGTGGSSAGTPKPQPKPAKLTVDGFLGPATIRAWQKAMGTAADGRISYPRSELVVAVQRRLNRSGARLRVDGRGIASNNGGRYPGAGGTDTIRALQRYLGLPADGYLSAPSNTVKALQRRLNTGRF